MSEEANEGSVELQITLDIWWLPSLDSSFLLSSARRKSSNFATFG